MTSFATFATSPKTSEEGFRGVTMTSGRGLWGRRACRKAVSGVVAGRGCGVLGSAVGAWRRETLVPAASSEEAGEPGAASAEAGLEHGPLDGRQALNSRSVVGLPADDPERLRRARRMTWQGTRIISRTIRPFTCSRLLRAFPVRDTWRGLRSRGFQCSSSSLGPLDDRRLRVIAEDEVPPSRSRRSKLTVSEKSVSARTHTPGTCGETRSIALSIHSAAPERITALRGRFTT